MKTIEEFPHNVTVIDGEFIILSDGVQLASKIWLPDDANDNPVPAILEYLPYRYQDGTAERDALTHPYFAGHGYACVRVDMRGSGNSTGVLRGEYLKQEQDDALEVIDWITSQPWCSGSVGIIGISWGGFNGLQIAARQPEPLKAIITICSTDDRYADDIHYMGGAMLLDNIAWSTYMFSINTTPPDPLLHGDRWKDVWMDRLQNSGLWLADWLEHQHRDDFYKHGSICENYDDIKCPVYAVGGWADGYSNAIFRMMSNLKVPFKGLIGPWAHKYPHFATPGPAIGFLQESLRWWDHWLKGQDTQVMDGPVLTCYMQESTEPKTRYDHRAGYWFGENELPGRVTEKKFHLGQTGMSEQKSDSSTQFLKSPQTVGRASGMWCSYGVEPDMPGDQRVEAGGCLNFDSERLTERLELFGAPVVKLNVASICSNALLVVSLNEVLAGGAVNRITYGILNLTHRASHENPEPLGMVQFLPYEIQLNEVAHRFEKQSKIRLSISSAYWPIVWPSPESDLITIVTGDCELNIPVRDSDQSDEELPPFPEPEAAPPLRKTVLSEPSNKITVTENIETGEVIRRVWIDEGVIVYDDYQGWTVASTHDEIYAIHPDDPCSAVCGITWTENFSRGDWEVSSQTQTFVTSTPTHFYLEAKLQAWEGEDLVHEQSWEETFERKLV